MSHQISEQLGDLREIILEAGAKLLQGLDCIGPIGQKGATEIVTEWDRRVEELILGRISRTFPGDCVEAEESGAKAGTTDRTWFIDPLDGTTNFAHGYPIFAVSMACADEKGLVVAGVYAPYLDELYLAQRDTGAVMERPQHGVTRVLEPRVPVELSRALLATGFPYNRGRGVDRNAGLVRDFLKLRCHGVRRGGSAAMDLVHVAAGKLDGYWEADLRPWDTGGGTLIAREAGVKVTGYSGSTEAQHYRDIVAAAPGLHGLMLAVIEAGPA